MHTLSLGVLGGFPFVLKFSINFPASNNLVLVFSFCCLCVLVAFKCFQFLVELVLGLIVIPMMNYD